MRYPSKKVKTLEDILERTERVDDCLIWTGGMHEQGYGMMRQDGKMRTVHSVIAEMKYGYTPDKFNGERVTRTCKNLACCNPGHIIIEDASQIQRTASHRTGIFTDDDIREIRDQYENHRYYGQTRDLAKKYGVVISTITSICKRRMYKRVK